MKAMFLIHVMVIFHNIYAISPEYFCNGNNGSCVSKDHRFSCRAWCDQTKNNQICPQNILWSGLCNDACYV